MIFWWNFVLQQQIRNTNIVDKENGGMAKRSMQKGKKKRKGKSYILSDSVDGTWCLVGSFLHNMSFFSFSI